MRNQSPLLTLNNGVQIPAIGLGVFQNPQEKTVAAVESAIARGYRLVDTAASYFNERHVCATRMVSANWRVWILSSTRAC
jgi:diketogulonate reductase-like aldo/keto reductase